MDFDKHLPRLIPFSVLISTRLVPAIDRVNAPEIGDHPVFRSLS